MDSTNSHTKPLQDDIGASAAFCRDALGFEVGNEAITEMIATSASSRITLAARGQAVAHPGGA